MRICHLYSDHYHSVILEWPLCIYGVVAHSLSTTALYIIFCSSCWNKRNSATPFIQIFKLDIFQRSGSQLLSGMMFFFVFAKQLHVIFLSLLHVNRLIVSCSYLLDRFNTLFSFVLDCLFRFQKERTFSVKSISYLCCSWLPPQHLTHFNNTSRYH